LGKKHPGVSISAKRLRQILINLGLRYPRGPKTRDIGTQVKRPFAPHAIWEGDGKQVNIIINGLRSVYSWYAFVDQNTTLIVGSATHATESSTNFLQALKNGKFKTGTLPVGVLIDNRLSDEDMSPIDEFCKEHQIVLLRTFPGNSKSNGNIENNFSLFESLVGPIRLFGSHDQIAQQVATLVIEIFTGLRNNTRRPRLNGQTPADAAPQAKRPEHMRSAIESMANRFTQEIKDIDFKWNLIHEARQHFGHLSPESVQKTKRLLCKYPVMDIIAAQAAYLAQIKK
jgi:transposase InsO family protein